MALPTKSEHYPPDTVLSPAMAAKLANHRRYVEQLDAAKLAADAFDDAALDAARKADNERRQDAVKAGKPAASAGSPAVDKFASGQAAARIEVETLEGVVDNSANAIVDDITNVIEPDDKLSGRTTIEAARAKYLKAIGDMLNARDAFAKSTALAVFWKDAQLGASHATANYARPGRYASLPQPPRDNDPQRRSHPVANRVALERWLIEDATTTASEFAR